MKNLKLSTLLMLMLFTTNIFAQQDGITTVLDKELMIERLLANKKYINEFGVQAKDAVSFVPIKYHILRRTDGTAGKSPKDILELHCAINEFFEEEDDDGLQFYINDGFNYIDNTEAYENHFTTEATLILSENRDPNAINIFIPNTANQDTGSSFVTLGYYSSFQDWLVIGRQNADGNSLTAMHLLGFYFSIPNPYNGWDVPYNETIHGNPVMSTAPDGTPTEKMDGSNCDIAGDFICDTPPSYNFFWPNCDYDGGVQDPDGVLIDPDELNIMDNFNSDCLPKYFSPGQKELILADYQQRTEIQTTWAPNSETVAEPTIIIQPENESVSSGFEEVLFEWEPVEGADFYLLEIDRLANFSLNPTNLIVEETYAFVPGIFLADRTYSWRVTPFNPYITCADDSGVNEFTTGTTISNNNVLEVNHLSIDPNPVSNNNMVITLETANSFDAEISIISITGQTLQTKLHHFGVGTTNLDMRMNDIPNGMYLVNIKSGDRLINKKIVVSK